MVNPGQAISQGPHRWHWLLALLILAVPGLGVTAEKPIAPDQRPDDIVDAATLIPGLVLDIRYTTDFNFVGEAIDGYIKPKCLLTRRAAKALRTVQEALEVDGMGLKIFDCYRPQRAVDHFVRWAADTSDTRMKETFYPSVAKDKLFELGYIAERSGHSRGSTLDVTLVKVKSASDYEELDMGTRYDFFDELSHTDNPAASTVARNNRQRLKAVMESHGFVNLPEEWWHYTLRDEPYSDVYFDFPVE
ncbi:MAG: M15 family metallopeptidase [Porticoccaceae bacterium]